MKLTSHDQEFERIRMGEISRAEELRNTQLVRTGRNEVCSCF